MKKIMLILLMIVLLLNVFQPVYAGKKIYKRWWFWPAVTVVTAGILYSFQQPEQIDYRKDSDGDTIPDYYEVWLGLDPYSSNMNKDSDGDGYDDVLEFYNGSDPLDPESLPQDDAHLLSIQRVKTANSPIKVSYTLNPTVENPTINIVVPLRKEVWFYGSIVPKTGNYNIQIIRRF
jgi:hypothetical protein